MATIIAIVNRKGGVGKSATTANLAAALAREGKRVLAVDSDSQRNLTTYIGVPARREDHAAATITHAYRQPKAYTTAAIAPSTTDGVDLLYGSSLLEETEREILAEQMASPGRILSRVIRYAKAAAAYDLILIDCPPAEGLLTRNAIVAASILLTPVQTDYSGVEGVGRLKDLVAKLDAEEAFEDNSAPPIYTFPTFVDERVRTSRDLRDFLRGEQFATYNSDSPTPVINLNSQIHRSQAIPDSYGDNVTVFDYAPVDDTGRKRMDTVTRARGEYTALAQEVLTLPVPPHG